MDLCHLTAALSLFRTLFQTFDLRFTRLRYWTPERVAIAMLLLVARPELTSIEKMMPEWANLFDLPRSPSDSTFVEARQKFIKRFPNAMRDLWRQLSTKATDLIAPRLRTIGDLQWVAIDGSWVWAPHEAGIIAQYGRPSAGAGRKLHYPQFLLVSAIDVLTRVPLAAAVLNHDGSERAGFRSFIDTFQAGMVAMFDRGYPAKDLIWPLVSRRAHFLWRMGTAEANSWDCVHAFLKDRKKPQDARVTLHLTPAQTGGEAQDVEVRLIRRVFKRGRPRKGQKREVMVLMTTLLDDTEWPVDRLIAMYERRWVIEDWHRDVKVHFHLESFHSRSVEGVQQELFALMAWMALCAIIERNAFLRVERSRGPQDPQDPCRFQISMSNLYCAAARIFVGILKSGDVEVALAEAEIHLQWLDSTARRRRPGRSRPRKRLAPHGRWNG